MHSCMPPVGSGKGWELTKTHYNLQGLVARLSECRWRTQSVYKHEQSHSSLPQGISGLSHRNLTAVTDESIIFSSIVHDDHGDEDEGSIVYISLVIFVHVCAIPVGRRTPESNTGVEALHPRVTTPSPPPANSMSLQIWLPLLGIIAVVAGMIFFSCVKRRRLNAAMLAARRANGNAATEGNGVGANGTGTTTTRRPRRTRRTPSQISTKSLPAYNEDPGEQEIVLARSTQEPEDPMPTLNEEQEGSQSNIRTPLLEEHPQHHLAPPQTVQVRRSQSFDTVRIGSDDSHEGLLRRSVDVPHPSAEELRALGNAPAYFEVVDDQHQNTSHSVEMTEISSSGAQDLGDARIAHLLRSASSKKWYLGHHVATVASYDCHIQRPFQQRWTARHHRAPASPQHASGDLSCITAPNTALPAVQPTRFATTHERHHRTQHHVLPPPLSVQHLGPRQPHPLGIATPARLVRPQPPPQPRGVDLDALALLAHLGAAAAHADADRVPVPVERADGGADALYQLAGVGGQVWRAVRGRGDGAEPGGAAGGGAAGRGGTPPPPFDAPGNPGFGRGPGPGDSQTSLRSVGGDDGETAGMVTAPQSLGRPSLEAAGEDGSDPVAGAETPVGGRMPLSGAGEKTADSDDMSGDTSLASLMDASFASISTPNTTFTVGHPPDAGADTPALPSLALYIPGVPTTAAAKSVPTPPPTPPSSQHSHSQWQASSSRRLSVPVITVAPATPATPLSPVEQAG
ncbi:hypothetical protein BU17DRAFT_72178 [Hysterangium stoloniferum]|nr:hypothetical protein BU17DRAFT_72178 [Hysterangium stoloniferum]